MKSKYAITLYKALQDLATACFYNLTPHRSLLMPLIPTRLTFLFLIHTKQLPVSWTLNLLFILEHFPRVLPMIDFYSFLSLLKYYLFKTA